MRERTKLKIVIGLAILVALTIGTLAIAARPGPRPGPGPQPGSCPNFGIYCLDVWDPVTCDNGVTYSNQCYADRACATGCTPGGATQ